VQRNHWGGLLFIPRRKREERVEKNKKVNVRKENIEPCALNAHWGQKSTPYLENPRLFFFRQKTTVGCEKKGGTSDLYEERWTTQREKKNG